MRTFLVRSDNVRFGDTRDTMTRTIHAKSVQELLDQIWQIYQINTNITCFQLWTAPLGSKRLRIDTMFQDEFDALPKECNAYIRYARPNFPLQTSDVFSG